MELLTATRIRLTVVVSGLENYTFVKLYFNCNILKSNTGQIIQHIKNVNNRQSWSTFTGRKTGDTCKCNGQLIAIKLYSLLLNHSQRTRVIYIYMSN